MNLSMSCDEAAALGLRNEPGWIGAFTRNHAPGTMTPGTRVVKTREDKGGDRTPLGTKGSVLGSIRPPGMEFAGYFIEWDGRPRVAVFMIEWKIEAGTR